MKNDMEKFEQQQNFRELSGKAALPKDEVIGENNTNFNADLLLCLLKMVPLFCFFLEKVYPNRKTINKVEIVHS